LIETDPAQRFWDTSGDQIMRNITTISDNVFDRFIKPMDYVSNGTDVGRYFGTTDRGTRVVAWGDKRDDHETAVKLIAYLQRHSAQKKIEA
jgi:hypothetical protein